MLKKMIIITLIIILNLLSIEFIDNNSANIVVNEDKRKVVDTISRKLDDEIKQQQNNDSKINQSIVRGGESTNTNVQTAIGRIVIDSLCLNYPILDGASEENLNISITRFSGSIINELGNCVLAGHNMKDGSLFGRLSELRKGDKIVLYNNLGKRKSYRVFNIKIVSPIDLSVTSQHISNSCLITLITCTSDGKNRLVIQAKEAIDGK